MSSITSDLDVLLKASPAISVGEAQALINQRDRLKSDIKAKTKQRKALPKEDHEGKAELSKQLKQNKKRLNAVEQELTSLLSPESSDAQAVGNSLEDYREPFHISESLEGWSEFVGVHQTSFYHRFEWRGIFRDVMNRELKYLTARNQSNQIVGVLPLAITRSRIFGTYGVSLPYVNYGSAIGIAPNVELELMKYAFSRADDWELSHLELRDTHLREGLTPRTDKVCMVLDLVDKQSFGDLLTSVGTKVRAQVNKSLGVGIEFSAGGNELLKDFYTVFARNMRDLGTPVYSQCLFSAIVETFPEETLIVVGRYQGKPISAAFLIRNGTEWEIPWASTIREGNKIAANMALYATVLREIIERGASTFDFGRSSVDAPTYKFKKQWRAEPKQLYWYYSDDRFANSLTTSSRKFQLAIRAWQYLPLPIANSIGPLLVKNLP